MRLTINMMFVLMFGSMVMACGGGATSDSGQGSNDMTSQEQVEIVAAALTSNQGGVGDDIAIISQAANGQQQPVHSPSAVYDYSVSVNIDFYDAQDHLQDAYDPFTTDRIDYDSLIQGEIIDGAGFFTDLSIDNRSDFTVDDILSRTVWINGIHTNHSSYRHVNRFTQAEVNFQLDSELIVTDVTVELDVSDTFPESGTIEGTLSGSFERITIWGRYTRQFDFHFIATYLGDNTAEVELSDGTVYIVRLGDGSVEVSD